MVIAVKINANYGSPEITNKYSPLTEVILNVDNKKECFNLFSKRNIILQSQKAYGECLRFYVDLPEKINPDRIPMVVISSKRSKWMSEILQNAQDHGKFEGYSDKTTFNNDIVPWYSPFRSLRPLFVVVHMDEYRYYLNTVGKFKNVVIIGYKYSFDEFEIVGFGASRYAAIQAMISLGYHKVWAVDDNVVNINVFPKTLEDIEKYMIKEADIWGIGFKAATKIKTKGELYDLMLVTDLSKPTEFDFEKQGKGLLQQVVLWNLDLLRKDNINFSLLFVTSNEDVSLCNFLNYKEKHKTKIINALEIIKIIPVDDIISDGGNNYVPKMREKVCQLLGNIEANFEIKYYDDDKKEDVIKNLHNSAKYIVSKRGLLDKDILLTQMRIAENIMSEAIKIDPGWYPENLFNPFNKTADTY